VDRNEATFAFRLEQPLTKRLLGVRDEGQGVQVGETDPTVWRRPLAPRQDACAVTEQLNRAERACRQEEIIAAVPGMGRVIVSRVVFPEHNDTGTGEALRPTARQFSFIPNNFTQEPEGERVLVEVLKAAISQVVEGACGVDRREFVLQEEQGVVTVEGLKMEDERFVGVVVLDLDAV